MPVVKASRSTPPVAPPKGKKAKAAVKAAAAAVAPPAAPPAAPAAADRKPKTGEIVLHTAGALTSRNARWFATANVEFKRPSGQAGPVDWLCLSPEELSEANNDPFAAKYVNFAVYQEPPPVRVIEIPDLPVQG